MNDRRIDKRYACLYIDVTCYKCKRKMALSYCRQIDGRYHCQLCTPMVNLSEPLMKEIKNDVGS